LGHALNPAQPMAATLRLVCINDVYELVNLPRLRTLVLREATTQPAELLLVTLAGDFLAPSLLSSVDRGAGMVDCLNAVPVTHVCFGNHEDDVPFEALKQRVAEFRGCWINSNLGGFPELPTHQVIELSGSIRVGIVGAVSEDSGLYRPGSFGQNPIAPLQDTVCTLGRSLVAREGCACVIALTHQSIDRDRTLAANAGFPLALIVGGHEHDVHIEETSGVWILKAGADAASAVIVDLTWRDGETTPTVSVRLEDVRGYEPDAEVSERVAHHMRSVKALKESVLMRLAPGLHLSSVGTRTQQTSVGTMICSRVRDAMHADVCVLNGGGIRGSRDYTEVFTYGDLETELPFANEVVTLSMPGRVLRNVIESSRARAPTPWAGFLQVDDGVTVEAQRVVSVCGAPIEDQREYRVALLRLLLDGLDGIEALTSFINKNPERVPPPDCGREIKMVMLDTFAIDLWRTLGAFDHVDTNRDGRVCAEELRHAIAMHAREPVPDLLFEALLRTLGRASPAKNT
jgi:2',3'-cyclic-nucleotide 2'-phosphodiesterase (5'-nucleotidase family)